jgi:hypothetical protein
MKPRYNTPVAAERALQGGRKAPKAPRPKKAK